jgi:hypothetical protein
MVEILGGVIKLGIAFWLLSMVFSWLADYCDIEF